MTRGLADELFGTDWRVQQNNPSTKTVSVKSHSRTRVIGGPSKTVGAYSYSYKAWPTMDSEAAMGGQPVMVDVGGSRWTVRVSGNLSDFCDWLKDSLYGVSGGINVISQRGTIYGPFGVATNP
ncbi:MAG: hypothetical protein ACO29V_12540 [Limnohabitans sp.]